MNKELDIPVMPQRSQKLAEHTIKRLYSYVINNLFAIFQILIKNISFFDTGNGFGYFFQA